MTAVASVSRNVEGVNISVEMLNLKTLREGVWSLPDFVNWLLQSHIHFIIAHPHQGTESFGWSIESIYAELQRLKHHQGFPSGKHLDCPIFTQDKWNYIKALPDEITMPTFKIPISSDMDMRATEDLIGRCV
jgi:hypothetical protein